ncbi:chlorite dismutase family protein [Plastoroseomonas arctica]|uniref:Chlorite dismutase n=1 Tax=Plastoroseomonas arctica TaxID=1509237 RepID=A0AAF1JXR4_9PROT|nr:chlorite dismutase family protein [Plastoroseomonas arctica]MBR0655982.1 chlorite dismutase [Plastoroseomonas arctica]
MTVAPLLVAFAGADAGRWRITSARTLIGPPLPAASHIAISEGTPPALPSNRTFALRGVVGNLRYTNRSERDGLAAIQAGLARPQATRAALIPIRKTPAWWALAQDERRAIFEEQSRHIGIGMAHLPAIARRLHHARELGEPFDFVTWFEYAPEDEASFEALLASLRATPEWAYIDREIDIRLART